MTTPIQEIPEHIREHTNKALNNHYLMKGDWFCTCYHCNRYFMGHEIKETVDGGETVLCPFCHVDSVIPVESKQVGNTNQVELNPDPDLVQEISNFMFSVK